MFQEEAKVVPSGESDKQSSVHYWANGLNFVGYVFLALTFVFAFAPKITIALPLFLSLVFACAMFVASAFVKTFKSDEWEKYCRNYKKEATIFSILNLFATCCFIILFLLTGGFGLFHMVFSDAIPDMSKHMVIGSVTFLAVGTITLLLAGIIDLCSVKGFFAKSVDEYYRREGKFPGGVGLNPEEKAYVKSIASLTTDQKAAYHLLDADSPVRSSSSRPS